MRHIRYMFTLRAYCWLRIVNPRAPPEIDAPPPPESRHAARLPRLSAADAAAAAMPLMMLSPSHTPQIAQQFRSDGMPPPPPPMSNAAATASPLAPRDADVDVTPPRAADAPRRCRCRLCLMSRWLHAMIPRRHLPAVSTRLRCLFHGAAACRV